MSLKCHAAFTGPSPLTRKTNDQPCFLNAKLSLFEVEEPSLLPLADACGAAATGAAELEEDAAPAAEACTRHDPATSCGHGIAGFSGHKT